MILKKLTYFLFPNRCPFCGKFIDEKELCCNNCNKKVQRSNIESRTLYDFLCFSSFPYHTHYKKAILFLKRRKFPGKALGKYLAQTLKEEYSNMNFDIVTSVPLHKKKLLKRGYNQAELLAMEVSRILSVPYKEVLIKTKNTEDQHNLKGKARVLNVRNAYRVCDKNIINNKNILLIDDIITTGCTLGECSKLLWNNGANSVSCATVCRVE